MKGRVHRTVHLYNDDRDPTRLHLWNFLNKEDNEETRTSRHKLTPWTSTVWKNRRGTVYWKKTELVGVAEANPPGNSWDSLAKSLTADSSVHVMFVKSQ